ncbi:MAG: 16S rRNA (adenine(1518)-N(6)/adenine(1519)-N(6))-dimethyltransferase RsmA [Candidatus Omnitrophota bacterium]|nr:16S rRNA (adenine(1518)-N(6)/adenine(1519)-N(6))-dimethyltransferase RsmA [Candidatus Omnitrophota bacterium]MDZ4243158.1 16S rRNA (adenine(1518)-N(6)/adenine(1519)-N(6))-dimethyltransferase RsmA [Candidatus Omnitrophota bacterium]
MNLKTPSHILPKKHLGQHFLCDPAVRDRIIEACDLQKNDMVLEIGPGLGVLTEGIASRALHVYAVETDLPLCRELDKKFTGQNVTVLHADILQFPFGSLPSRLKVIGNLPYNISSPIIERMIVSRSQCREIFITVQLEFGERLIAKAGAKDYGALTCFVQYYFRPEILFKIGKGAFRPAPKVTSCFIRLTPSGPGRLAGDEGWLFTVIRHAFQQRRKTIVNALGGLINKEFLLPALEQTGIQPKQRPETLSLEDFVRLADASKDIASGARKKGRE